MYQFRTEQFLRIDIREAWDFFSSPTNLAKITPPELDFKILTGPTGKEIHEGMKIDYKVKPLFGIPVHWQTEISKVVNQNSFTDCQTKGPYKVWRHTHEFMQVREGVLMFDEVSYKLPFGIVGKFIHSILIKKKIENIFAFRRKVLDQLFNSNEKHLN